MKVIRCEMCGSQDLVKQDGVFVCQACGTKYSVEEAKKMLVEGTVEVAGIVKVDQSDELNNLYTLARRARNSEIYSNGEKYYSEIMLKDPNSWEANFYSVFYNARNANIGSIPSVCNNLISTYHLTMDLLIQAKGEDIQSELEDIFENIAKFSTDIVNSTLTMNNNYLYIASALRILNEFGDSVVAVTESKYKDIALKTWEKTVEQYQNTYNSLTAYDGKEYNFSSGADILVSIVKAASDNYSDVVMRNVLTYINIEDVKRKIKENSSDCEQNGITTPQTESKSKKKTAIYIMLGMILVGILIYVIDISCNLYSLSAMIIAPILIGFGILGLLFIVPIM